MNNIDKENVENCREKRKKKFLFIYFMMLILLALITLCVLGYKLGKIDIVPISSDIIFNNTNNNTEIIDSENKNLTIEKNDILEKTEEQYNNSTLINNNTENTSNNNVQNNTENTEKIPQKKIATLKITEENMEWDVSEKLDVFANPKYNYKLIIAPGSEYYYQFLVENYLDRPINYKIIFTDKRDSEINLKYKLKLDNSYIKDKSSWQEISKLNLENIILAPHSKNLYILEWKWIEGTDEIDTNAAGKSYELFINVIADEYEG